MPNTAIFNVLKTFLPILFFSLLPACSEKPQTGQTRPAEIVVLSESKVLATLPAEESHNRPVSAPNAASGSAPQEEPMVTIVFHEKGRGVAYAAKKGTDTYVVYNGRSGNNYEKISRLTIGPDGERLAYAAYAKGKWLMVIDGLEGPAFDELEDPVFSPDGQHFAYFGKRDNSWFMVLDKKQTEASVSGYRGRPIFSSDSTKIAFVAKGGDGRTPRLMVTDLSLNNLKIKEPIASVVASRDKSRLAAVAEVDGKQRVIVFNFDLSAVHYEAPLFDKVYGVTFGNDGQSIAYFVENDGKSYVASGDRIEELPPYSPVAWPLVRPDGKGVDLVMVAVNKVLIHSAFYRAKGKIARYDEINDVVYNREGVQAFAAKKGNEWVAVVAGKEGPKFDMVVNPLFSPDGKFFVYRARKDGKRFVVVADSNGSILSQHFPYEMVFTTVFTADGGSVAYGVKDGRNLAWKVEKLL